MLKQASDTIKPRIGFVRGHGETTLNLMSELVDELSHLIGHYGCRSESEHL